MIKKVKEMIKIIELDGWVLYAQKAVINNISIRKRKEGSLFLIMGKAKY